MGDPVFVIGVGLISAIGQNLQETLDSFENGRPGIRPISLLHTRHAREIPAAEVPFSNQVLAEIAGLDPNISRTALLGTIAARQALQDAWILSGSGFTSSLRIGFISANTVGGMDKTEDFFPLYLSDHNKGKLHNVAGHECGRITEITADALGIRDFVTTVSTACSSSANSIALGARLIKDKQLDLVVAGGVDALSRFTINGFNTLMILDQDLCKPFDENRKGLNLGEGAGYIVLSSEKAMKNLGREPYCLISGYANANDAYHQTASSPGGTGSLMAMKKALDRAGLNPAQIDYINLHGTGTQNNDVSEGTAIKDLFTGHYPKMSSTKSFTGHTLGASGGIEAVFSALSIHRGLIYPNLRFQMQMKELPFAPETRFLKNEPIHHVLSNSFGFGGNCSALVFSAL